MEWIQEEAAKWLPNAKDNLKDWHWGIDDEGVVGGIHSALSDCLNRVCIEAGGVVLQEIHDDLLEGNACSVASDPQGDLFLTNSVGPENFIIWMNFTKTIRSLCEPNAIDNESLRDISSHLLELSKELATAADRDT